MSYKPIESYGIIGDMHTVALVGKDGSIDWCCLPTFDSPSVFGSILDDQKGGFYRIHALGLEQYKQMYLPDTNVLVTRFLGEDGIGEVTDFMPVRDPDAPVKSHEIVRVVRAIRNTVRFRLECRPAFNYAQEEHTVRLDPRGAVFEAPSNRFSLISRFPLHIQHGGVACEFELNPNERATFILRQVQKSGRAEIFEARHQGEVALKRTVAFWRNWLSQCNYEGRWREMVHRSALVLKLLTYEPTGAIVAAPTTSLPEEIRGVRNWDYRYCWLRDAAFTIYAFLRLGFKSEAQAFMNWLAERYTETSENGPLQIMYGIDGRHELPERELTHLDGYRGSRPVRIGNNAAGQLQLDIYGEVMDSIYLYDKYVNTLSYDGWKQIRRMMAWLIDHWQQPDEGIWEVRGGRQHFVYSKVQCWVALDRTLRLAHKRSLPLDHAKVMSTRDAIYEEVMTRGWNAERATFVQHYGAEEVDAANLVMPLMFFIGPTDPRMKRTIQRTMDELVSDSLVYRYGVGRAAAAGLEGGEGTFNMCTFWLVEALSRAGQLEQARFILEKMITYANHLGLYAEETGPAGEALGNYPQAFTHMGLISAAFNLDRMLGSGI